MSFSYTTTFSLIEWLAVMGLGQSLLILVYIVFRAHSLKQASLALDSQEQPESAAGLFSTGAQRRIGSCVRPRLPSCNVFMLELKWAECGL